MKRKARTWWMCEFCWQAFSTKRSARAMTHNGCTENMKAFRDNGHPVKIREVLPKRKKGKWKE